MPGYKKHNQYLGLDKLNVYREDTSSTSQYFKVSGIPETLPIGKSSFTIRGSKFLKALSDIKVEIIDAKGGTIYSEFMLDVEQSDGRAVSIEVYSDTPVGNATIHIVGEIKGVPEKWRGIYNARWSKKIFVDPTQYNKQPIKFIKKPEIKVEEKNVFERFIHWGTDYPKELLSSYYNPGQNNEWHTSSISLLVLSDEIGLNTAVDNFPSFVRNQKRKYGEDYLASRVIGKNQNDSGSGYAIAHIKGLRGTQTGSFRSEMIGGNVTVYGTSGSGDGGEIIWEPGETELKEQILFERFFLQINL